MILFDYGHTLGIESRRPGAGMEAILRLAARNPRGWSAADIESAYINWLRPFREMRDRLDIEFHEHQIMRYLYGRLGIEFDCPPEQVETVFWDALAPANPTPHLNELLAVLRQSGVRSGVVSNISFSGTTLRKRVEALTPGHAFEFIIASSEVVFRKPRPEIFEYALAKAGLSPGEVWFCGDNTLCDVDGSAAVGMKAVWYHCADENTFHDHRQPEQPTREHLAIHDWRELIDLLVAAQP